MTLRVSRNLYKALLRNVQQVEKRAPPPALAVIQKTVLGPERLLPLGANMVRKSFRAPTEVRRLQPLHTCFFCNAFALSFAPLFLPSSASLSISALC
jgi:hypothetical protein